MGVNPIVPGYPNVLERKTKARIQRSHDGRRWDGGKAGDRFVSFVLSNSAAQKTGDLQRRRGLRRWERDAAARLGTRTAGSRMQITRWYVQVFFLILYFSVTIQTDFERRRKKTRKYRNRRIPKPHALNRIQKKT